MMMVINVDEYISDNRRCTQGVAAGLQPSPSPKTPKLKFKKDRFCRYYDIKSFT
jgi:hypothetical protein